MQTLYTWRRQLKSQGMPVPGDGKNPEGGSSEDKFGVVLETAALNEAELAEAAAPLVLRKKPRRSGGIKRKTDQRPLAPALSRQFVTSRALAFASPYNSPASA